MPVIVYPAPVSVGTSAEVQVQRTVQAASAAAPSRVVAAARGVAIWSSVQSGRPLDDEQALTLEIISDPQALAEIAAARDEVSRGDVVQGVDAVRAIRRAR